MAPVNDAPDDHYRGSAECHLVPLSVAHNRRQPYRRPPISHVRTGGDTVFHRGLAGLWADLSSADGADPLPTVAFPWEEIAT